MGLHASLLQPPTDRSRTFQYAGFATFKFQRQILLRTGGGLAPSEWSAATSEYFDINGNIIHWYVLPSCAHSAVTEVTESKCLRKNRKIMWTLMEYPFELEISMPSVGAHYRVVMAVLWLNMLRSVLWQYTHFDVKRPRFTNIYKRSRKSLNPSSYKSLHLHWYPPHPKPYLLLQWPSNSPPWFPLLSQSQLQVLQSINHIL